ncbi:MAG: hypothetical protein ACREQH_02185 [Candidatus Binatus sp.]
MLIVTVELPILSWPPVVSLCEHNKDAPPGGVKLMGHKLNSEGSPVTVANAVVARGKDIDTASAATNAMYEEVECR